MCHSTTNVEPSDSEAVVETTTGVRVVVPAYPAPCTYVRLVDANGDEYAYWDVAEWGREPAEVMGAIVGAILAPDEAVVGG